jgi:hypothetical protein
MMGISNVDLLKGRTIIFGIAVGLVTLFILAIIKLLESRRVHD